MTSPRHPYIERRDKGFGPVASPPSSSGACLGGVPPEIGLEALALPTSRLLMKNPRPLKIRLGLRCLCPHMDFRDLSCDLAGGLLYTKWPLDVRILGHRDAIARDSVTWHTLLYDRARPRPRLSDRAGVCLCKGYDSIDNMVEATCL